MPNAALVILNQPSADAPPHEPGAPPFRLADPALPQLNVLDLGATRGDGVFESIGVAAGTPHALEAHLARLENSAALLELPAPDRAVWRAAVLAVVAALDPAPEALVKAVLTRGVEGDGRPTGWAHASTTPDHGPERATGLRVVTLDRGYRHDVERTSPWLLAGAKTLSYAVNRAALREAARRGADDVVFVSSDGYVLEGPTSTVVFRRGQFLGTPGTGLGILEGTTQGDIFDWAKGAGFTTGFELLTPLDLLATDAAWLVSSGRHAAPIRELDGREHPLDAGLTANINRYLATRTN